MRMMIVKRVSFSVDLVLGLASRTAGTLQLFAKHTRCQMAHYDEWSSTKEYCRWSVPVTSSHLSTCNN